jgi:hypothetical protein
MSGDGTRSGWLARIRTWRRSRRRTNPTPPTGPTGAGDLARSKRLGALLYLYMESPADPLAVRDELDPDELEAFRDISDEDMHLANACLEVERWAKPREIRREIKLVERLLAADLFGEEEVTEAIERGEALEHPTEFLTLMALGLLD